MIDECTDVDRLRAEAATYTLLIRLLVTARLTSWLRRGSSVIVI